MLLMVITGVALLVVPVKQVCGVHMKYDKFFWFSMLVEVPAGVLIFTSIMVSSGVWGESDGTLYRYLVLPNGVYFVIQYLMTYYCTFKVINYFFKKIKKKLFKEPSPL